MYTHTQYLLFLIGVSLSEEERTLACPGQPVHYTCISPRVSSITWHLLCQDQQPPASTFSVGVNNTHDHLLCTSAENEVMVSYDFTLTYASNDSTIESNISITVLEIADSVTHLNSLRISCESQDSYKYLDVTGEDDKKLTIQIHSLARSGYVWLIEHMYSSSFHLHKIKKGILSTQSHYSECNGVSL